ncbi:hypothetical protein LSUB1_G001212 [Lachnellula subtilissima]|uniref:Uncharacterized protein n=1 Tax=Lachnellula subtilissima TaxID=602034 RepID=A0A8H8UG42_9HELO|nr:hypothetical protein LSUB1_G001212 [Lachnellula subtilissima]
MEPVIQQNYVSLPESKPVEVLNWRYDWTGSLPPPEMPIWQYTTAALDQHEASGLFYGHSPPISSFVHGHSPYSSTFPSPSLQVFHGDAGYPRPVSEQRVHVSNKSTQNSPAKPSEITDIDGMIEDEDSDNYSWEPKSVASASSVSSKSRLKRTQSNKQSLKNAKRAHTVTKRKKSRTWRLIILRHLRIRHADNVPPRTKPSKSLVMTRAKERLKQLEARNKALEGEVVKLRQHIAILDHIVASKGGAALPSPK